ncbi:MAG: hypothetical protein LC623_06265 [Halobacteriales archaeon]|nr:hypothetical protein [Halobacteriales archaeon]
MRSEACLAALLVLAGCASPALPTAPAPAPHLRHAMDLSGCSTLLASYVADPGKMQDALPPGYAPAMAEAEASLEWQRCGTIVLDNTTVLRDVSLVLGVLALQEAGPHAAPGTDRYVLETYVSSPELAGWLRDRGLPAQVGDIGMPGTGGGDATLRAPGVSYALCVGPDSAGRATASEGHQRLHHAGPGGVAWADRTALSTRQQAVAVLAGQASGGAAGHLTATPGLALGDAYYDTARFLYLFDKETPP